MTNKQTKKNLSPTAPLSVRALKTEPYLRAVISVRYAFYIGMVYSDAKTRLADKVDEVD